MKAIIKAIGIRCFISLTATTSITNVIHAQKQDYIWLSGYDSEGGYDSSVGYYFGTSVMNFNYSTRSIYYDSLQMNFDKTNTSYCDSNGNLMFYTNGIYIANALDDAIENSDSLNAGYFQYVWDPTIQQGGYRNEQGILILQNIVNPNQYYLIYAYDSVYPSGDIGTSNILVALLDMSVNNGLGKVIFKNQSLISDSLGYELTATKHGNGRDWWVLVQKRNTNCYYRILVDSSGPHALLDLNCGGEEVVYNNIGSSSFSPDGSKYAHFDVNGGVNIFDFDRCSGELSNPVFIPLNIWAESSWLGNGIAVSPNSRFLYVSATKIILQYDLWASDIASSVDTVGIYDGYEDPFNTIFHTAQIGPDGKIYISCANSDIVYHVINNPDAKGDSCQFMQHAIHLPSPSLGVPNFPNYRLGPGCDSTFLGVNTISASKEQIIKIFPNPANEYVIVDYGFTDWNKGEVYLEITNALGQTVYEQSLPMYSGFQRIDVSTYASGFYVAYIKRQGGLVGAAKFAKE